MSLPTLVELSLLLACTGSAVLALGYWRLRVRQRRAAFVQDYNWPPGLLKKLRTLRPELTGRDAELVAQGLRQFFMAYQNSGHQPVAMPSQLADDLWHAFILYTRAYEAFCRQAFGHFFHHTPAAVLGRQQDTNAGLRRCWWWVCKAEHINPAKPSRLPLLFALDAKFGIADGFRYVPDCGGVRRADQAGGAYCAGDFSDASVDGSTDGFGADGHGASSASDSSSDSSGCSGGGCGGGD